MTEKKQENGFDRQFQEELFCLVMDAVSPWVLAQDDKQGLENWSLKSIAFDDDQICVCVVHDISREQFTALFCCADEPEIIGVSRAGANLGMLNPYLENGYKIEADLDSLACWNVLSITFAAEEGADAIRFLRKGKVEEIAINEFGVFSIVDWESCDPVDEYLGVRVNGEWKEPVVGAMPYTIDHVASCWRKAVYRNNGLRSRWNRWITAAFVELSGSDRAVLQKEIMSALANERNQICLDEFRKERRRFLEREQSPLEAIRVSA